MPQTVSFLATFTESALTVCVAPAINNPAAPATPASTTFVVLELLCDLTIYPTPLIQFLKL